MLITDRGVIIRFHVDDISQTSRATLGVRLMKMEDDAKVVTMTTVDAKELEKVEEESIEE